jgi:hypothetical protein
MRSESVANRTKRAWSVTIRLAAWLGVLLGAPGCMGSSERQSASERVAVQRSALGGSGIDVVTRNYDFQRSGANTAETQLTTANVNPTQFGKLFGVTVDDQVYGQILFKSNLYLPVWGVTADVFFVATVNDSVYAFDAYTGRQYWYTTLAPGNGRVTTNSDTAPSGCNNFSGKTGIVGTPVIDPATGTMFLVARSIESGSFVQRLYSIYIGDGTSYSMPISFSSQGVNFDPRYENQRPALALSNGVVYVAWGTFCDKNNGRGWVAGFDEYSLELTGAFPVVTAQTVPSTSSTQCAGNSCGQGGGIWQGGGGLAIDNNGSIYAATGNGVADATSNFGYSLIKLAPWSLGLQDFFTASVLVPSADTDFGSSGPVFLPNSSLVTVGDKEGKVYVMDSTSLGGFVQGDTQIVQKLPAVQNPTNASSSHIHGSDVTWVGPDGTYIYVWGENDYPRSYVFMPAPGLFYQTPISVGPYLPPNGMPGGMITLSSNGNQSGTGILWGTTPSNGNAAGQTVSGVLHAFNAETLALLWTSTDTWNFAKDNPPIVANGEVFVPTFSNQVNVYGITQQSPVFDGQIVNLQMRNSLLPAACVDVPNGTTDTVQLDSAVCNWSNAQYWQFNNTPNGWQIQRPAEGMCMDIPGNEIFQNQSVVQAPCIAGSSEQLFTLAPVQDGMAISPASAPGWCLTFSTVEPGTGLTLLPCITVPPVGFDQQAFTAVPAQLRKQNSNLPGMCIDVPWASTSPGVQLQTYNCHKGENQSWQIFPWGDGSSGIRRNGQNLCFDVPNGTSQGSPVKQNPCSGAWTQKWVITSGSKANGTPFNGQSIMLDNASILCVDVPNNSNSPNQLLRLWSCNGTDAQVFSGFQPQLRKVTSGTAPGLCMDVRNNQGALEPCTGTATQNWELLPNGLISSSANGCLGLQGSIVGFVPNMTCTPTPAGQSNPTNLWTEDPISQGGDLRLTWSSNLCLDAPFGWNTVFAPIHHYNCNNGTAAQAFTQ